MCLSDYSVPMKAWESDSGIKTWMIREAAAKHRWPPTSFRVFHSKGQRPSLSPALLLPVSICSQSSKSSMVNFGQPKQTLLSVLGVSECNQNITHFIIVKPAGHVNQMTEITCQLRGPWQEALKNHHPGGNLPDAKAQPTHVQVEGHWTELSSWR